MGMVYHPQRIFCTIAALYFSADHTLGLLLERLLDCVILLYCLLIVYLYWKLCSFCCTFLCQQPTCARHFTNNFEELVPCPKRMFYSRVCLIFQQHTRVIRLASQSLLWSLSLTPFLWSEEAQHRWIHGTEGTIKTWYIVESRKFAVCLLHPSLQPMLYM